MLNATVTIADLRPGPNARPISQGHVDEIRSKTHLLNEPIIIDCTGEVIEGMHRLEARKQSGFTTIDVVILSPEEIKMYCR